MAPDVSSRATDTTRDDRGSDGRPVRDGHVVRQDADCGEERQMGRVLEHATTLLEEVAVVPRDTELEDTAPFRIPREAGALPVVRTLGVGHELLVADAELLDAGVDRRIVPQQDRAS